MTASTRTISIVTFKWEEKGDKILPSQKKGLTYTDKHVLVLKNMLERNLTVPFRFVCITDSPIEGVECMPLWDKFKNLGGCYNRLYMFSEDMKKLLGERLLFIDLDVVITGNIDHIVNRKEDFVINEYRTPHLNKQKYNGALVLMDAGCRSFIYDHFDPENSPALIKRETTKRNCIGTDQAWISLILHKSTVFTEEDGVYEVKKIKEALPKNACMVFFAGPRDPSLSNYEWVKNLWR